MSVYSVTLYVGQSAMRYKLDDLIRRSFNGYLDRDVSCTEEKLYFPIAKENDQYFFANDSHSWKLRVNAKEDVSVKSGRVKIKHGDYLEATLDDVRYAALFLEESSHTLASVRYETDFTTPVMIGRGESMHIMIDGTTCISRDHAAICLGRDGVYVVEKDSSQTGVYVNGMRCSSRKLESGDAISIGGVMIVYVKNGLIVPANIRVTSLKRVMELERVPTNVEKKTDEYVRVLRIYRSLSEGTFEIDPPSAPQKDASVPFILTAGPSMTMAIMMLFSFANTVNSGNTSAMLTNGAMTLSMLAGSMLWPSLLRRYNKKQRDENEAQRVEQYGKYIARLENGEEGILERYEGNTAVWHFMFPSPQRLLEMTRLRDSRIWERTPRDADFLTLRLGLVDRPFEYRFVTRRKGFSLHEDSLEDKADELVKKYQMLKDVPQTLSLMEKKSIGVIGLTYEVAKSMILNLAFFHASEEVKLVLVYNRFQAEYYSGLSVLPHNWSDDRTKRYTATTKAEAYTLFSMLEENIQLRETQLKKDDVRVPHYVCLVFDASLLDEVPFKRYLLDSDNKVGVSAVFFGDDLPDVPKECARVIQKEDTFSGIYHVNENQNRFMHYKTDVVNDQEYSEFLSAISALQTRTHRGAARLPESINFLDVYQVGNVGALGIQNRWSTNASHRSLAAVIGVRENNEAFALDIHEKYHGCHGLVAGTTGSGKSEFLQAYILSMMINYSPNEVGFVLVDFKGGDMASPFLNSPHLAATISNLSENTLYRALVSLNAEVKTRQNIFKECKQKLGVDKLDINSYHRYFKEGQLSEPLPHLIIIIDEFAQLKSQHGEFMTELISIAQVGRSLGIHLILATQKPNGVVDPQIWSNSRFKVCLKVADKQDSSDMIGRQDAALIKNPGRAYVQIGYDEVFEQIQSGYSGAEYIARDQFVDDESASVSLINATCEKIRIARDIPERSAEEKKKTQISAVVSEIRKLGEQLQLKVRPLWLEPLPEALPYESLSEEYAAYVPEMCDRLAPGRAVCGMLDLPEQQEQLPYEIDFLEQGNLAVFGSTGTGTSTFVQTLAYSMALRYSPEWFNLIVLDCDGGSLVNLSNMPHCAGYFPVEEEQTVEAVLRHLEGMISQRRALFAEYNCASYESYLAASGESLPLVLLVLDNYSGFRERAIKQEEKLIKIVSTAKTCGIYTVITGNSRGAIYYRLMDHMTSRIVFTLNDSAAYRDLLNVRTPLTPDGIKGRALVLHDDKVAEVQIGVPFDCQSETERNRRIAAVYEEMTGQYGPNRSMIDVSVKEAPEVPQDDGVKVPELKGMTPIPSARTMIRPFIMGLDMRTGQEQGFETDGRRNILLAGKDSELLFELALRNACEMKAKVFVITQKERSVPVGVELVKDIDQFVVEKFSRDEETDGIYIVDGFVDLFMAISDEVLDRHLLPFLRTNRPGCFITLENPDALKPYMDTGLAARLVKACDQTLVVGGNVHQYPTTVWHDRFNQLPIEIQNMPLPSTQALAYSDGTGAIVSLRV